MEKQIHFINKESRLSLFFYIQMAEKKHLGEKKQELDAARVLLKCDPVFVPWVLTSFAKLFSKVTLEQASETNAKKHWYRSHV